MAHYSRKGEKSRFVPPSTGKFSATGKWTLLIVLALGVVATFAKAQRDPGPRPARADAGGPFVGLSSEEVKLFWAAKLSTINNATN